MRAKPLPPQERRAAIIAAALPLLTQHGPTVSTRDVAEAAGIAEGTLFRVFATKDELIEAVLADVMDPQAACTAIRAIADQLPLEGRLIAVMDILTERIREVTGFFLALRLSPKERSDEHAKAHRECHQRHTAMVNDAIRHAIGADAATLRVSADQAAVFLSSVAFVTGHPMMSADLELSTEATVQLVLHGLIDSSGTSGTTKTTSCVTSSSVTTVKAS